MNNNNQIKLKGVFAVILGTFLMLISLDVLAQEAYKNHSVPSPTASNIVASDYFPLDYYTGRAQINIPLYNISSKGMNMPISLSYNSGGVRVNDPNGWVGQNWNLNVGGVITREVKGSPDDHAPLIPDAGISIPGVYSYFNLVTGIGIDANSPEFIEENVNTFDKLSEFIYPKTITGQFETEPDIFSFNFMGYSGKFFMGIDGEWKVISENNVKIELNILDPENWTTSLFDATFLGNKLFKSLFGFKIIDEYGNKYTFGFNEEAIEFSIPYFSQNAPNTHWTANSWYLTKVENVNDEVLFDLHYKRGYYIANISINDFSKEDFCKTSSGWESSGTSTNKHEARGFLISPSYLDQITTFYNETVDFISEDSDQLNYKSDSYYYDFALNGNYLPYLQLPPYTAYTYPSTDDDVLYKLKWKKLSEIDVKINGVDNRNVSFSYNDNVNERLFLEDVTIKENSQSAASAANSLKYKFDYTNKSDIPDFLSAKIDHFGYQIGSNYFLSSDAYDFNLLKLNHFNSREPNLNRTKNGSLEKITFPTGGYTKFHYELNNYSSLVSDNRQSILNETGSTCGLRVSKVEMFDTPDSTTPTSTREIFYTKDYAPNSQNSISSGVLALKPKYVWIDYLEPSINNPNGGYKSSVFSNNIMTPLGNMFESHIGYEEVTEVYDNKSYITYKYDSHKTVKDELPISTFELNEFSPYSKFTDKSFLRGKQTCKSIYDSDETILEKVSSSYREDIRLNNQSDKYDITSNAFIRSKCFNPSDYIPNGNVLKIYYFKDYIREIKHENFRNGSLEKLETYNYDILTLNTNEYKFLNNKIISDGEKSKVYTYTYPKDNTETSVLADKHMVNLPISTSVNGGAGGGSKIEFSSETHILPRYFSSQNDDGSWKLIQELKYDNFDDTYPDKIKEIGKAGDIEMTWSSGGKIGLLDKLSYFGREWDYGYNDLRQLTSSQDYNEIESTFLYDGLGRLTYSSSNNGRLSNTYSYEYGLIDGGINLKTDNFQGSDGTGYLTEMIFDGLGREITSTKVGYLDGGGDYVTTKTYDALGRLKEVTDPGTGGTTVNTYESSPLNVLESVMPAGSPSPIEFDNLIEENNFVIKTTDEDGIETKSFTDIFGRNTKNVDGMGFETVMEYNDRDQVLTIDPPGDSGSNYVYTYFPDGKLEVKTIPDKGDYVYTYNEYDQIETETLPNEKIITNNYHGTYNDFLTSREMDGHLLEEYIPIDLSYVKDFIGEESYSIHWGSESENILGQRHVISHTSIDQDFGRSLAQNISTLDGEIIMEMGYDDLGNMKSQAATVTAFNNSKLASESWTFQKGIREKNYGFLAGQLSGGTKKEYNGNDWLVNKKLGSILQEIKYEYNPRGWLNKINSVGDVSSGGNIKCKELEPPEIPDFDCENLLDLINTFIIHYDCEELANGNPTGIEIEVSSQSFENGLLDGITIESIEIPINGGASSESILPDEFAFNLNDITTLDDVSLGIYNLLLDCILQNPDLLPTLEDLINQGLIDNLTPIIEGYQELSEPEEPPTSTPASPPVFGMEISYYGANEKLEAISRYNGNISWMKWKTIGDHVHTYGFTYDDNNRLTKALYGEISLETECELIKTDKYSVPDISYDELGNIQSVMRKGLLGSTNNTSPAYGPIDALTYIYPNDSPNIVQSVIDASEIDKGFKGGSSIYTHDGTGNMNYASNRSVSTVYSFNDLPISMKTPKGKVLNFYTSSGIKLKSILLSTANNGFIPKITNYIANQEYENNELKAIYFREGRATYEVDNNEFLEYYIKDHLGNTRVRIADKNGDNNVFYDVNNPEEDEVMASHHYYPFGMEWDLPQYDQSGNSIASTGVKSKYTYNGKEYLDDLDINLHYYGFRVYDPAIGRFTSVDPIAEEFAFVSGFNYAENEPIANIDLHGLQAVNSTANSFHSGQGSKFQKSHPKTAAALAAAPAVALGAGIAIGSGTVGVGLMALRTLVSRTVTAVGSGITSATSTLSGMMKAAPSSLQSGAKSLIAGTMGERAVAVGTDIVSQTVVNAATGAEFNFASTVSAAIMPNAYLTQGFIAGAVEVTDVGREGGGHKLGLDFNPYRGLVGAAFGKAGGTLGNGIGKTINSTSRNGGVSMASFLKNMPSLVTTASREIINDEIK